LYPCFLFLFLRRYTYKQRGALQRPSLFKVVLATCGGPSELEAYRELRFTRIANPLTNESVEVKQWRTAATDCVYVVLVIKQVEDLHFGDDLEPLSDMKWPCRTEI